jgi:hypothetical protein
VPLLGFLDFEAMNIKQKYSCNKCQSNTCKHRTLTPYAQEAVSFSLVIATRDKEVIHSIKYTGADAAKVLMKELLDIENDLLSYITKNEMMHISDEDEQIFQDAENCWICNKPLRDDRVRDHDHIKGGFIGAAHNFCNLQRKELKRIPLYCHNLRGYDSHFILRELNDERIVTTSALPSNGQKLKAFSINSFHFMDSLDFLQGSLSDIVQQLPKTHDFSILDQSGLYSSDESSKKKLLLRKGVYCYEWATSLNKLKNTTKLPAYKYFYSKLANRNISPKEYRHAQKVFDVFNCENMQDYTELYCVTDVYLLAEVVFAFRDEIYDETRLDFSHYMSLPQLSFDMMLKLTDEELELMPDPNMILFVESAIRGGHSFINERYASSSADTKLEYIDGMYTNPYFCV